MDVTGSMSSHAGGLLESVSTLLYAGMIVSDRTTNELLFKCTRLQIDLRRDSSAGMAQSAKISLSMPTHTEGSTSEYRLTEDDLKGDLNTMVKEEELDSWKYDEDEEVDLINHYESADDTGNISEDSDDRVYNEDGEGKWSEGGGRRGLEKGNRVGSGGYKEGEEDEEYKEGEKIEVEESSSLTFIKFEDVDVEMIWMGKSSEPDRREEEWGTCINPIPTLI
ncbi:hypothetical protein HOY80DRAFT_1055247 [Tuber brumale]|nr:hypothetical protein HOY80DRAFT_1055247 [Tuber brumale]